MLGIFALVLCLAPDLSRGHGRLVDPPGRASMWKYGFDTPPNYNDNQLFCGGFRNQYGKNGGRCGVCGDDYSDPQPRAHEGGGRYATGTVARTYSQGEVIDIEVEITAAHMGWFEFRLCPHNNPGTPVTQECLDRHLLQLTDGRTRVKGITSSRLYEFEVRLPPHVTCTQCVLQWRYHTGNKWGREGRRSGMGFGPQEEFYGCADVRINTPSGRNVPAPATPPRTAPPPPQTAPPPPRTAPPPPRTAPPPTRTAPPPPRTAPPPPRTDPPPPPTAPPPPRTAPPPPATHPPTAPPPTAPPPPPTPPPTARPHRFPGIDAGDRDADMDGEVVCMASQAYEELSSRSYCPPQNCRCVIVED